MSIDPLRMAARALAYWERRQEVATHNVANTETPGYKGQRVFAQLLAEGGPGAVARDDWSQGALRDTGRPLDVAVQGAGFLVVETPEGELLRRGGSLSLDAAGVLIDGAGHPVLGEEGMIVVPAGEIAIDPDGTIRVDGSAIGRLRVEDAGPETLRRMGAGLWASDASEALAPDRVTLRQGSLEESNVEALEGLVEMLDVQRNYAAIQKSVITLDSVMDTAANRIGRVG
jgi:flagellar basal body rod protein FlgG